MENALHPKLADHALPPPNTEEARRDLAWDLIDSSDSKFLYHLLADMLCGDWEVSDDRFNDWWKSVHDPA